MTIKTIFSRFGLVCGATLFATTLSVAANGDNTPTPELHRLGMALYKENCAICHGANGEGDGSLAQEFSPKPRNFSLGTFRFVSTPNGAPPSREDLVRTIRNGIEGSYGQSMPAFPQFSSSEMLALAEVVRQFAAIDAYGTPVEIPPQVEFDIERAIKIYDEYGCSSCHGASGKGDGPAAQHLEDESGEPIKPANFSEGKFKGGNSLAQIWLRIHNGVPGTPMPSFGQTISTGAPSISTDDIWAVTMLVAAFSSR